VKPTVNATETHSRAIGLYNQGSWDQCQALCLQILQSRPEHAGALYVLGMVALRQTDTQRGVDLVRRSLHLDPTQLSAHVNLGLALMDLGKPAEAIPSFESALRLKPDYPMVHHRLGQALATVRRHAEAVQSFDRALKLDSRAVAVLIDRGNTLQELSRFVEAIADYDRVLQLSPESALAYNNRGNALKALRRYPEALGSFDQALRLDRRNIVAFNNKGNLLQDLQRHAEAAACFAAVVAVDAKFPGAIGALLFSRLHCCNWESYEEHTIRVADLVSRQQRVGAPFFFLTVCDSPAAQRHCASNFAAERYPPAAVPMWRGERYTHDRIRVAYLSADLHSHATAYLMARLFEVHDRTRFEITAISFGPDDDSPMRARLKRAFDRFIDARDVSDLAVAQMLRQLEIDIAVDLKGFTSDGRLNVFAHRPAPIQVSYLGYPGTTGVPYMDYIVADREVIPAADQVHYSEHVVYLPECYQVNDSTREAAPRTPRRIEAGLPDGGFVFCCFNSCYKITPAVFDVWMRLLRQVPSSVLWLLQGNAEATLNLRREAEARGVDPDRLIFAPSVPQQEHLARLCLADLFLDTLPVNAHTTASDALWAGLPVLTCRGRSFVARVAGSLLEAVGLPQLVADSLVEYERRALELAGDPSQLASIRAHLTSAGRRSSLFDSERTCRHLESAYEGMWQRYQRGERPAHFAVVNQP
jgi:predicted O-linked N-acetylglucosamine transferase (SPINDLY family)